MFRKFLSDHIESLIITATISLVVLSVKSLGGLQNQELATLDRLFQSRPPEAIDNRIVIVGITEPDIQKYQPYPFSDAVLADLIKKIKAQNPRVIGLDIVRDIPVNPGHDELVQVFRTTPNLIGSGTLPSEVQNEYLSEIAFPPILKQLHRVDNPRIGDITTPVDSDYVTRRGFLYPLMDGSDSSAIPSFSLSVAYQYLASKGIESQASDSQCTTLREVTFFSSQKIKSEAAKKPCLQLGKVTFARFKDNDGGYNQPAMSGYQILLNWRGAAGSFKHVSVAEVLEKKVGKELFNNKIVLIGAYAPSLKDISLTPFTKGNYSNKQPFYGIEVHAQLTSQFISAVLDERPLIKVIPEEGEGLWLVIWVGVTTIGVSALAQRCKNPIVYLLVVSIYCGVLTYLVNLITLYLFINESFWVPSFFVLLGVWSSSAIAYAYNLNRQRLKEQQDNAKKLERDLELAKEQIAAQERLVVVGRLVEGLNHQFRNLFRNLRLMVQTAQPLLKDLEQLIAEPNNYLNQKEEQLKLIKLLEENLEIIEDTRKRGWSLINKLLPVEINSKALRAKKELIELDNLIRECYNLALTSNFKSSLRNLQLIEEYDLSIPTISVVPAELSLVLIYLITNAFDALEEKQSDFFPKIKLITKKLSSKIQIIVQDNGIGVSSQIKNEIFNLFFTTKKADKGTGLGLSYARDIIVTRYQGNVYYQSVKTEQNSETQFVVEIPIELE